MVYMNNCSGFSVEKERYSSGFVLINLYSIRSREQGSPKIYVNICDLRNSKAYYLCECLMECVKVDKVKLLTRTQ